MPLKATHPWFTDCWIRRTEHCSRGLLQFEAITARQWFQPKALTLKS